MSRPPIPTVDTLRSASLSHRWGDLFNPPGLTNFRGAVQAAADPTAIRSIAFPPTAIGELGPPPYFQGIDPQTCVLFLDGEYVAARRPRVTYTWQPDRVTRHLHTGDLEISADLVVPFGSNSVVQRITVQNTSAETVTTELGLGLRGGVTRQEAAWVWPQAPGESDNMTVIDAQRGCVTSVARHSEAAVTQGTVPPADVVSADHLTHRLSLQPGERRVIDFTLTTGRSAAESQAEWDRLSPQFPAQAAATRREWNAVLHDAFTSGNARFGGHLPLLDTDDPELLRLYHTAVMTLLFHRRETPAGVSYITLAPRYWQTATFLWDISLAAPLLAQLEPGVLRSMMEQWMQVDIHQHFGTDYRTGDGIGPWYSVNDFAMCRMAREYLRWTGDHAWLDRRVGDSTVLEHLRTYATHWNVLDTNGHGLADYGEVGNLLEAVGSYVHEVAGLNAANAENLRFVADLLDIRRNHEEARSLRAQAAALVRRVQDLYVEGAGHWRCRLPDGSLQAVRHCYDFATVLTTIPQDLSSAQRSEMVRFFREQLQTEHWMRALSTHDRDVTYSIRPDHQWTGAYSAWPAISLMALFRAGEPRMALTWLRGLARTMRQGPVAQAHFAESAVHGEPRAGALKAPSDPPWINDWSCVAGAAFAEPILYGLFGIDLRLDGGVSAAPRLGDLARTTSLRNLRVGGRLFTVDRDGVRRQLPRLGRLPLRRARNDGIAGVA